MLIFQIRPGRLVRLIKLNKNPVRSACSPCFMGNQAENPLNRPFLFFDRPARILQTLIQLGSHLVDYFLDRRPDFIKHPLVLSFLCRCIGW